MVSSLGSEGRHTNTEEGARHTWRKLETTVGLPLRPGCLASRQTEYYLEEGGR